MAAYEPAFSHVLGIRPWEIGRLSYAQWARGRAFIDTMTGRGTM